MSNPVEEYLRVKEASSFISGMGTAAKGALSSPNVRAGGAFVGLNMAALAALKGLDSAYMAITKKRDFNKMLEHHGDLQEAQQANPKQFNAHFTSLRNMNPEFSQDPIVAGTYMRQMTASPDTAGMAVANTLAHRRGMAPGILEQTRASVGRMPFTPGEDQAEKALKMEKMRSDIGQSETRGGFEQARDVRESQLHPDRQQQMKLQIKKLREELGIT